MHLVDRSCLPARHRAALFLAVAALATASCDSPPPKPPTPPKPPQPFTISYKAAGSRLAGLPPVEAKEQIRDWVRLALAENLGFSAAQVRDSGYDTFPVRDAGFSGVVRQPVGPGRELYDGKDVLHLLISNDDDGPRKARTTGLLLDQFRTDSGSDAPRVQVHQYHIDPASQTVTVVDGAVTSSSAVRAGNGYHETEVDTLESLRSFLAKTSVLSRLERHGNQLRAGGWDWPVEAGARVDAADVTVLQQGYQQGYTGAATATLPGFSLDPQPAHTVADLLAVVGDLDPGLAQRVVSHRWVGSGFASDADLARVVQGKLSPRSVQATDKRREQLPDDRTQLWALLGQLSGSGAYSQARYEGGLAGTEVGMTLFYTDYVAKSWTVGTGAGVPTKAVEGFVPDTAAATSTPWSHCPSTKDTRNESGRLWFGQNDAAFRSGSGSLDIGAEPARLFARSNSAQGEVEPSYRFGRGLRWWDEHYQAVADHEPQYQRLAQLMSWSGALDWLVGEGSALPTVPESSIRRDLRFQQWYAEHSQLRERAPITFVRPVSDATKEALAPVPTAEFSNCGLLSVEGGVSLANRRARLRGRDFEATLPPGAQRAGLLDPTSTIDPVSGRGTITSRTVDESGAVVDEARRGISTTRDGEVEIATTAPGRKVESLGEAKVWARPESPRGHRLVIAVTHDRLLQRLDVPGGKLGTLEVTAEAGNRVDVAWASGEVDRAVVAMHSVQRQLAGPSAPGRSGRLPEPTEGVAYGVQASDGTMHYRIGPKKWLTVVDKDPGFSAGDTLRVGGPSGVPAEPSQFLYGVLQEGSPDLGPVWNHGLAQPDAWLTITPASINRSPRLSLARVSPADWPSLRVASVDGGPESVLYRGPDGRFATAAKDQLLLPTGPFEGVALMREISRIRAAQKEASGGADGLSRVVPLGDDGVAFVAADGPVLLAPPGHRYLDAVDRSPVPPEPDVYRVVSIREGTALAVDKRRLTADGTPWEAQLEDLRAQSGNQVFMLESERTAAVLGAALSPAPPVPFNPRVKVLRVVLAGIAADAVGAVGHPDLRIHHDQVWRQIPGQRSASTPSTATTPAATMPGGSAPLAPTAAVPGPVASTSDSRTATTGGPLGPTSGGTARGGGGTILLVCPVDLTREQGCAF